jgi:hypothetical protein
LLLFTTHGWHSVRHYELHSARPPEQLMDIAESLTRGKLWFADEFGAKGDHGVVDSGWGSAFFDPRWAATNLCPSWNIVNYFPGREDGNQDVYVLRKVNVE